MSRVLIGRVVSDKMDKTIVVAVERLKAHPIYRKQYKSTARYKAHDEQNQCKIGNVVEITECRPLSRQKAFVVTKIDGKAVKAKEKLA